MGCCSEALTNDAMLGRVIVDAEPGVGLGTPLPPHRRGDVAEVGTHHDARMLLRRPTSGVFGGEGKIKLWEGNDAETGAQVMEEPLLAGMRVVETWVGKECRRSYGIKRDIALGIW